MYIMHRSGFPSSTACIPWKRGPQQVGAESYQQFSALHEPAGPSPSAGGLEKQRKKCYDIAVADGGKSFPQQVIHTG